MNCYRLESREIDKDFLEGKIIKCQAALSAFLLASMHEGDHIVVELSTRAKYKARIERMQFTWKGSTAEGYIFVVRIKQ